MKINRKLLATNDKFNHLYQLMTNKYLHIFTKEEIKDVMEIWEYDMPKQHKDIIMPRRNIDKLNEYWHRIQIEERKNDN